MGYQLLEQFFQKYFLAHEWWAVKNSFITYVFYAQFATMGTKGHKRPRRADRTRPHMAVKSNRMPYQPIFYSIWPYLHGANWSNNPVVSTLLAWKIGPVKLQCCKILFWIFSIRGVSFSVHVLYLIILANTRVKKILEQLSRTRFFTGFDISGLFSAATKQGRKGRDIQIP